MMIFGRSALLECIQRLRRLPKAIMTLNHQALFFWQRCYCLVKKCVCCFSKQRDSANLLFSRQQVSKESAVFSEGFIQAHHWNALPLAVRFFAASEEVKHS